MNINKDGFTRRILELFGKIGDIQPIPLSRERLEKLRSLIPLEKTPDPGLSLEWKRVAGKAHEILSLVQYAGLRVRECAVPSLRDGEGVFADLKQASLPMPHGELVMEVIPEPGRNAKLVFSVRGDYAKMDDLSVEISVDGTLVEARPLELKAEFALKGEGEVSVALVSGEGRIGNVNLSISEAKEANNGEETSSH